MQYGSLKKPHFLFQGKGIEMNGKETKWKTLSMAKLVAVLQSLVYSPCS